MKTLKTIALAAAVSAVAMTGITSEVFAEAEVNVAPGRTLKGAGIAIHGFDPVAYFSEKKPVQGSAVHSLVHEGATYRFSTAGNMKTFKANPAKYLPAYGGYCAFGVSVGAKFDGDPRYWKIVDGRLYLNLNADIQQNWFKDIPGNIKKAEKNWTKIKHKDPATLG